MNVGWDALRTVHVMLERSGGGSRRPEAFSLFDAASSSCRCREDWLERKVGGASRVEMGDRVGKVTTSQVDVERCRGKG